MGRALPLLATFLLGACGADFIEPNPPRLVRTRAEYQASSVPEPAVWILVADLYLEHDEDCAWAMAWLSSAIRAAIPLSAAGALELAPIQTSPCTQPNTRRVDPAAIDAAFRAGAAAFPGRSVRPVLVYANNVLLAVPGQIAAALRTARQLSVGRGALPPRLWALVPLPIASSLQADHTVFWTYAGDPALAQQIAQMAAADLPLLSDADFESPALPLFAKGPAGVQEFKICRVDAGVEALGFAVDGTAISFDPLSPPRYRVSLPARRAVPRSQFQPLRASIDAEACLQHCDRYLGDELVRWRARPRCFLPGGPS